MRGVAPERRPAAIQRWFSGGIDRELRADLEQRHIRIAARGVALRGERQRGNRRRAKLVEVGGDRVGQTQRLRRIAEQGGLALRHEAEGDALGETLRGECTPGQFGADLPGRERGDRHRRGARQRHRRNGIEAAQAQHLLDQVAFRFDRGTPFRGLRGNAGIERLGLFQRDLGRDVVAPGRHRDGDARRVTALHREAQTLQ